MKKSKKTKYRPNPKAYLLTICNACRIRLVVRKEEANTCGVCKSPDVVKQPWERN